MRWCGQEWLLGKTQDPASLPFALLFERFSVARDEENPDQFEDPDRTTGDSFPGIKKDGQQQHIHSTKRNIVLKSSQYVLKGSPTPKCLSRTKGN